MIRNLHHLANTLAAASRIRDRAETTFAEQAWAAGSIAQQAGHTALWCPELMGVVGADGGTLCGPVTRKYPFEAYSVQVDFVGEQPAAVFKGVGPDGHGVSVLRVAQVELARVDVDPQDESPKPEELEDRSLSAQLRKAGPLAGVAYALNSRTQAAEA